MSITKAISWFEPYWSYHQPNNILKTSLPIPMKLFTRLLMIASFTLLVSSFVLYMVYPSIFIDKLISVFVWLIVWIATFILFLAFVKLIAPGIDWLVPRWIRICPNSIEIIHHSNRTVLITKESLEEILIIKNIESQKCLVLKWDNTEMTVGISERISIEQLKKYFANTQYCSPKIINNELNH